MKALMSKRVIQALFLGKSNLHIIMRHCITHLQPYPTVHGVPFLYGHSPTIFYKRWIQSLAPHNPIVEGNGKNGHIPFSDNSQRHLATQSLVEGGKPRTTLWHYNEQGIYLENEWFKVLYGYLGFKEIHFLNWEDAKDKFSSQKVHSDFWLKLTEFYEPL